MAIYEPQIPPTGSPIDDEYDIWELSSTESALSNIYFCNNNKIYYDRNNVDKNVLNQLDQQDKFSSNFRYPNDILFGFNYNRANNRTYGVDNFNAGIAYKLFLEVFSTE